MFYKWILCILLVNEVLTSPYTFNEELLIEQFPENYLSFQFQFTSIWNKKASDKINNYHLYPKRLADIVTKFKIKELHLTLSQGTWKWGISSVPASTGAELWIVFESSVPEELLDDHWIQSSRIISGLFGLSINLIDNPNTVKPKFLFNNSTTNVRYATIPNEIVCTENLTPWIKLLPCSNRGVSQLLKSPPKLFEAHYLLLGLHFRKTSQETNSKNRLELSQTLSLVYDTQLFKNKNEEETIWSFSSVFNQRIQSFCPVASFSNIYMDIKTNGMCNSKPTATIHKENQEIYVYNLKEILSRSDDFNPLVVFKKKNELSKAEQIIEVHRYITEPNERDFGIKTIITNNHNENVSIVYFDLIPWYFRVYISSLKIKCTDNNLLRPELISFTPGLDRKRPHHIELILNLKSRTTCSVYFKTEYAFLKWDEYPPDVNHGFHLNPVLISVRLSKGSLYPQYRPFNAFDTLNETLNVDVNSIFDKVVNIYSETLLLNLPTPDFSMPYNVICLTCTALAIGFGSLHNFTTRKFIFVESKTLKEKIKDRIKKILPRLFY